VRAAGESRELEQVCPRYLFRVASGKIFEMLIGTEMFAPGANVVGDWLSMRVEGLYLILILE
jgi:hypothetical protein